MGVNFENGVYFSLGQIINAARFVRFLAVKKLFVNNKISFDQAKSKLNGPLDPDYPELTTDDDSDLAYRFSDDEKTIASKFFGL